MVTRADKFLLNNSAQGTRDKFSDSSKIGPFMERLWFNVYQFSPP